MQTQFQHPTLGAVILSQSQRARRITLSVRATGEVRLSYPCGVSQKRVLAFLEEKSTWVLAAQHRMAERTAALPQLSPEEERARIETLRHAAKLDLPARTARIAKQFGLHYNKLTIRATRTKWGCCTSTNNLSLSIFLMILPEHLRDYVITHELCHTLQHNHSPHFHALLDIYLEGKEKALNKELKAYIIRV
ncbi:MAG: YgjP-like metallopeptidase domain-containing protein [Alistipes sp.]